MKLMTNATNTFHEITVNGMPKLARYICSFVFAVKTQLLQKISKEMTLCVLKRHLTKKWILPFSPELTFAFIFNLCGINYFLFDRTSARVTVNNSKPVKLGDTNKLALPPQCHAFGVLGSFIALYFYVSSTVIRKNRNIDFLHIYI